MIVGVCDYPSAYEFPPRGYGSIERWLWAVARGAREWGAQVHLLGQQWRTDLPGEIRRHNLRLEAIGSDAQAQRTLEELRLDLLVVGHEYPSHPAWRQTRQQLECDVATFQHDPHFEHPDGTFDGTTSRLYCYSAEMAQRYGMHKPRQELCVQLGVDEDPGPAVGGRDLVWLGRVCVDKAPHLAAMAAARAGRQLRIIGPVHEPDYVRRHADTLHAPHVQWVGELSGVAKAEALRTAGALVYTCARTYIEAGAAVFADAIRAGTPVAALAWRPGTCADAALCNETGAVASLETADTDEAAADALALAIVAATRLEAGHTQEIGLARFDPVRHFEAMAGLA